MKTYTMELWQERFSSISKDKIFQRLVLGNFLWSFTHFAFVLVSGWVVLLLTNSPVKVILLTFFQFSALPVVGLIAGKAIDWLGNRTIMLVSQIVYTIVYVSLAFLIYAEMIRFEHLAICAIITGIFWSLDWPARRSILGYVVGENSVTDGYIIDYTVQTFGRVLGSAAAGIITKILGETWSYIGFTVLSLLAVCLIWGLVDYQSRSVNHKANSLVKKPMKFVWKYVLDEKVILGVLFVTMTVNFLVVPNRSLFPVFASNILMGDALYLGYLATSYSLGGFIGIFLAYYGLGSHRNTQLFLFGTILQSISFSFFSFSSLLVVSSVVLFLAGIGSAYFGVLQSEIILTHTSLDMRNDVLGLLVVAIGLQPLGRLSLSALTSMVGPRLALGGTTFVAFLVLLVVSARLPALWKDNL